MIWILYFLIVGGIGVFILRREYKKDNPVAKKSREHFKAMRESEIEKMNRIHRHKYNKDEKD